SLFASEMEREDLEGQRVRKMSRGRVLSRRREETFDIGTQKDFGIDVDDLEGVISKSIFERFASFLAPSVEMERDQYRKLYGEILTGVKQTQTEYERERQVHKRKCEEYEKSLKVAEIRSKRALNEGLHEARTNYRRKEAQLKQAHGRELQEQERRLQLRFRDDLEREKLRLEASIRKELLT
ncbi:hypothetical protein AWC38_SpisGene25710, partial [Stylophora pistillata]